MNKIQKHPQAFTLVELLVGCVLLIFLVLLLLSVFQHVAGSYQQTESRAESFRDGRAALHLMSKELNSLIDASGVQTNTNAVVLPRLVVESSGTNKAFGFLANIPQNSQPTASALSDVAIVGYFVAENTNATPPSRSLFRTLLPSDEAFSRLQVAGSNLLLPADLDPGMPYTEPVANNVVDFQVKVLDAEYQEIANPSGGTNEAFIEVDLTVIGSRSAQAYFAPSTPETSKERIKATEARNFVLRCRLKNRSN